MEKDMAKYGRKAQQKVKRAMHERKRGTLRSGRSGKKVTSRKQAIAVGLVGGRRAAGRGRRARAAVAARAPRRPKDLRPRRGARPAEPPPRPPFLRPRRYGQFARCKRAQ